MLSIHAALLVLPLLACSATAPQAVASAPSLAVQGARSGPRTVAILVYEGVELLDFAGPGEVFAAARGADGRGFQVVTVARTKARVRSQGFVDVVPQHSIADCPAPDVLVLPGGNVPEERELVEWVRRCAESAELVMSVCNGAFLLAEAGLLDGLEVTTHHGSLDSLAARYPDVRVLVNRRFVDTGRVMTCAGVSAGIDGALHVVARMLGTEAARRTARYMEYVWRPAEIAALPAEPGRTPAEGPGAELAALALDAGIDAALARLRTLEPRPEEGELNRTAYALLGGGESARARALFELVVAAHPASANARDSLADACERAGDPAAAREHAEGTLALLPPDAGSDSGQVAMLRNVATSRLVRLGRGDPATLRFACACAGCEDVRYVGPGACPGCGMELVERAPD
jgi:putative intracellular protease/amidase